MNEPSNASTEHLLWAQKMKDMFPDILASYEPSEIQKIWEHYSDRYFAATWLGTHKGMDEERLQRVFTELYGKDEQGRLVYISDIQGEEGNNAETL